MDRQQTSPKRPGGLVLPADVEKLWRELEWDAPVRRKKHRGTSNPGKAATARYKAKRSPIKKDKWHRKKARWIGITIAREFEEERKKLLAQALRNLAQEKLELALIDFDERQAAERKAYYEDCRRQATAYIEKLRKAAA